MDTSPRRSRTPLLALVVALGVLLATCGGTSSSDDADASAVARRGGTSSDRAAGGDAATRTTEPGSDGAPAPETEAEAGATSSADAGEDAATEEVPTDPALNAGRIDDGEAWEDYLVYRDGAGREGIPLAPIEVDARRVVTVVDADDRPVRGAVVDVLGVGGEPVATVRTHADGRAVVFAAPEGTSSSDPQQRDASTTYRVRSEAGDLDAEVAPDDLAPVLRTPGARPAEAPDVDLQLVLDATGSMSDEIERLKATLTTVVEGIGDLPGSPRVRLGMTVYRDQGDEFVTRTVPFTTDATAFEEQLSEVTADGGGDTPEAVEPALVSALDDLDWSEDPGTVRLAFLVADAPPHLEGVDAGCATEPVPAPEAAGDDAPVVAAVEPVEPCTGEGGPGVDDGPHYLDTATRFAAAGVKVVPVASSNLDPVGESVFRELALVTQAPFLFLTYGADGASPGDQRPDLHVDDFAVLSLDQMVARVVADELESVG